MQAQPDISIIIPTYNLEKHIGATLESILLQENISLEVLVIDDGSTDNTKKIVQMYTQEYPYIKLFDNEKTKGVSGARNTALERMHGTACFFLDGDDLLPPNILAPFFAHMQKHNALLARGVMSYLCHQRWLHIKQPSHSKNDKNDYPTGGFTQYLYDAKFIKNNAFSFPEGCSLGEDRVFFCQVFCQTSEIYDFPHPVYYYRLNHKKNIPSSIRALSYIEHFKHIKKTLGHAHKEDFFYSYLNSQFSHTWLTFIYHASQENPTIVHKYLAECASVLLNTNVDTYSILKQDLNTHTDAFWKACQTPDTHAMFDILKNANILQSPSPFLGLKKSQIEKHWKFFRVLHRIKNIVSNLNNFKHLYYAYNLHKKSKKFILNSSKIHI